MTEGHGQSVSLSTLIAGLITPGIAGDTETLTNISAAHGTATLGANNAVSYKAPAGGADTISYTVADQYGDTATGTVTVTVDPGPTAASSAVTEGHGRSANLSALIAGLITPGIAGDTETLTNVSAAHGTATLGTNNAVSYTAPAAGPDTISYTVRDQYGDSATGQVAVTVDPGPSAGNAHLYIAPGQSLNLTSLLLAVDTPGLPGDTLSLTGDGTSGTTGKVTLSNGQLSYAAPAGGSSDTFTYTVADQFGDAASGTVAVTLDSSLLGNFRITLAGAAGSGNTIDAGNGNGRLTLMGNDNNVMLGGGNDQILLVGNNNIAALGKGNDQVGLIGNNNALGLGGGNDDVVVSGAGNTAVLGNGNDNVLLTGSNNTLALGSGNDNVAVSGTGTGNSIWAGTGNDSFTLGGSSGTLALHGLHDTVSVNGGTESITDTAGGADRLTLQVGASGGTIGIDNFSVAHGVLLLVQTLAATQGWTNPGQIDAALTTDNHGGSLLSLGTHGSVDFQGIAKSQLTANNFHIG